jgi:hypothetical protein
LPFDKGIKGLQSVPWWFSIVRVREGTDTHVLERESSIETSKSLRKESSAVLLLEIKYVISEATIRNVASSSILHPSNNSYRNISILLHVYGVPGREGCGVLEFDNVVNEIIDVVRKPDENKTPISPCPGSTAGDLASLYSFS